ncbi:beta-1,4-galactosyltransferase 2 [Nothobranchius furzeri]|uniref:Beta-1,4-galactosyltransferase n=2 Tax=Nothobranchius furzeri TaxID=105023 RepID=A0A8C6VVU1_NOTFU
MGKKLFTLLLLYSFIFVAFFALFIIFNKGWAHPYFIKAQNAEIIKIGFFSRFTRSGQGNETSEVQVNDSAVEDSLKPCPETPPNLLGPIQVEFETNRFMDDVRKKVGSFLQMGGRYKPPDCISKQKVAIIIPFRHRHEHLTHWLYYVHPNLIRQQLHYGIYVINQDGDGKFNRAKLMNIGYAEALKEDDYDCFVFSDVDLVPLDDRNLYRCFDLPRHFSVAIDKFNYKLAAINNFGGVTALSKEQFLIVNGFPNTYWGWGGEDDDLYNRIMLRIKSISRPDAVIGRYKMIRHNRDLNNEQNPSNAKKAKETGKTWDQDGLNSLNYTVTQTIKDILFTFIAVDVHEPTE